ncbi:Membrane associated serine protease, rhomboid family [Devosia enhydra]|uniref:Membrane associated serine protease, rhomboid family n=1 Tax=Devosia enhydra TaxID=665118 RepID=A0A1K2HY61_9HYPH|nr:rhomboid family intramembrane serine protease [Devosia enhydra]SFZ83402.1 Membrane associated serine protease, rhomboid family [Devosia enhydra]
MSDGGQLPDPPENREPPGPQPIFLLPASVTVLAGLLAAIHLASTLVLNAEGQAQLAFWFGFIPLRAIIADQFEGGWLPLLWTPVTHAFLHAGWEHLLVNTAWLVIFATPVTRRYGAVPMLVIFLLSAVVGALAFAATTLPELQVLIGASGGVAGLTGAAVRFMFQPVVFGRDPITGEVRPLGRRLASLRDLLREKRARIFTLIWVLLNAAIPLLPMITGESVGIAWQAHLGGFFTGLLIVSLFEKRGEDA